MSQYKIIFSDSNSSALRVPKNGILKLGSEISNDVYHPESDRVQQNNKNLLSEEQAKKVRQKPYQSVQNEDEKMVVKNGNLVPRKNRPKAHPSHSGGSNNNKFVSENFQSASKSDEEEKKDAPLSERVKLREIDSIERNEQGRERGLLSENHEQLSFRGGLLSDENIPLSLKNISDINSNEGQPQ